MYEGEGGDHFGKLRDAVEDFSADERPLTCEQRRELAHLISVLSLRLAEDVRFDTDAELESLRHECKLGFGEARDRVVVGKQWARLRCSRQALLAGEIGFGHLALIAHAAAAIAATSSEDLGVFDESPFIEAARRESVNAFRYTCRELRIALDPKGALDEQKKIDDFRFLNVHDCQDGSVALRGHFSQVDGQLIRTALEPLARRMGRDDRRDKETRYADALTEICGRALNAGDMPRVGGVRPHLMVTTSLETLLGLSSQPGRDLVTGDPVHPKTIERLACDCSLTRIVMDADSVVIDVGRAKRVISPSQRKALCARDLTCRWPGCHRPGAYTAGHHLKYWRDGGKTDLEELALLCGRHHFCVHEGGWQLVLDEDGRLITVPPPRSYPPPLPVAAGSAPPF